MANGMTEIIKTNDELKRIYDGLAAQYQAAHGDLTPASTLLLEKAAYNEYLHDQAVRQLDDKGLREKYPVSAYRQGERENKALGQMIKLQAAQTKLLRELKLLPGRAASAEEDEDENAQAINDY